ncbi:hypothetical protein Syun_003892 [Stephania yunnanensis]|uniref:Matrin-type domain-containing protein n=1 Tax=Stephania yunnanensis TaxID=152371 RepID=A0AAP0L4K5_9MAGN
MTEYWVSQGNKWCDFCKIYISNNPLSIRTHELGQRHKDSVAKRLTNMRKEKAEKEKGEKDAARALQQIEAKKDDSCQRVLANPKKVRAMDIWPLPSSPKDLRGFLGLAGYYMRKLEAFSSLYFWQYKQAYYKSNSHFVCADVLGNTYTPHEAIAEWKYDSSSAYYYNQASGKWVKYEDIANHSSLGSKQKGKGSGSGSGLVAEDSSASKYNRGPPPGLVVKESVNPMRAVRGAPSSIALNNKRKRDDEKQAKVVSKEEADALKAREAAKKRVEEREKMLLGLYKSY